MNPEYVNSLVETLRWLRDEDLDFLWLNKYSSFIPSARELTATNTYVHNYDTNAIGEGKFTYDKIIWIDSDISWDVEMFAKLIDSDLPVVGGLYQTHPNGTVALALEDENGKPRKVNKVELMLWDEPVECWGIGFGFVAMKSGVFETIQRPWFEIEKIKWDAVPFETNIGEDYSWCMRARRAGHTVYVDPTVKVRHHKDTIYVVE
jgi:hypothetical protein